MFIPLKMVLLGIDPYPFVTFCHVLSQGVTCPMVDTMDILGISQHCLFDREHDDPKDGLGFSQHFQSP